MNYYLKDIVDWKTNSEYKYFVQDGDGQTKYFKDEPDLHIDQDEYCWISNNENPKMGKKFYQRVIDWDEFEENPTFLDEYDLEYHSFKKWFKENEQRFYEAQMNEKEIAFSAWIEAKKRTEDEFKEWDPETIHPRRTGRKCKIKITGEKKFEHCGIPGEFSDEE